VSTLPTGRRVQALAGIFVLTLVVFWPTLHNGFLPLGFDDALILDTPALRALTWENLRSLATQYTHAHFVPLTMLSFAIDYQLWGFDPVGYHLTNVLLHAAAAMLLCVFLWPIAPSGRSATLAALIFAVHPLQMEAVSVAVQRKTVLSGALFFLALILYQRWCRASQRRWYLASLGIFIAAALAKPAVVTLPLVLMLYDYRFRDGRIRLWEKLPFAAVAAVIGWTTMQAHAAVAAVHAPHGGTLLSNLLMVSRVLLEYVDALVVPLGLSPAYYYPRAVVFAPMNWLALAVIVSVCGLATRYRDRSPWAFFCVWWFLLLLLPESNLVPLAQLRADRFLYLPMVAGALGFAVGCERLHALTGPWSVPARVAPAAAVGVLAVMCYGSAAVWRDNVSAWTRVVERHPWCATAHDMLGRAYYDQDDARRAEGEFAESVRLSADLTDAHLYLAKLYAARGRADLAQAEVQRFLVLAPDDPEGLTLRAALSPAGGS
jgi:protein O-mannosyl-transferase